MRSEFIIKYGKNYLIELPVIKEPLFNITLDEELASTFPTPFNGIRFVRECKIPLDDIIVCELVNGEWVEKYIVVDYELTLIDDYEKCDVCGSWTKDEHLHQARYDHLKTVCLDCRMDGN